MVTIQPFQYEKTTAFKERVQIANKVNEIISLFNELDIESKINIFNEEIVIINGKITEINNALNEVNTAVTTVEGYNTRLTSVENESISLDARLDNIEPVVSSNTAKIGVLEKKDLENVKLSGNQTIENIKTFSNSPIVPNPPSGDTSTKAVNANWISQTGDSAPNNLLHKTGDETKSGILTLTSKTIKNEQYGYIDFNYNDATIVQHKGIRFYVNDVFSGEILFQTNPDNKTTVLKINIGNTLISPAKYGLFELSIKSDGTKEIITDFPKPSNW